MAFKVFESSGEGAYFTVLLVGGLISIIAVALRFLAARYASRKLGTEDWFAVAAVAILVARCIMGMKVLSIINGRGVAVAFDKAAYASAFRLIYVVELITMLDQTMAKLSICCLYLRIFGVKRSYARYIWFLGGLQAVTNLVLIFIQAFQCKPVDAFWKWWVSGKCLSTAKGVAAVEPPNSVIDFFLVVLAVIMVRSLQMSNKNKWNLRFLLGLGSLAGVFGFIKVGVVYTTSDPAKQMVQLGIWAVVQSFASIVCCCAPVYKPLLPANGLWGRLTSMVSQYRLRGSRSGGSGGNDKLDGLYSAEQLNNDSLERFGDTRVSQMESQSQSQSWVRAGASGSSEPLGTTQAALAEDHKHPTYVPNLAVYDDNAYPMNAIHVHRSVEIV